MMRVPTVIIGNHRDRHVTDFRFPGELGFLQVRHANHVHIPTTVDVRLRLGRKLWTFHIEIGSAPLSRHAYFLASVLDHARKLRTNRISKSDMCNDSIAKESIDAMPSAIEELIGNHKIKRLWLSLQPPERRHRNNPLHTELFEPVYIRAKIQLRGQNSMPTTVPGEKCDLAPFQSTERISIRRIAERCFLLHFPRVGQARHGVKPAAPNDSYFRLRQTSS